MKWKPYPEYKESGTEWLGKIPDNWDIKPVWMLFTLGRGRVISHEDIGNHSGKYPVYSSQTEDSGILGFLDTYDFDGNYLTWTTDGANAGTVFERHGKFNCTNVCGTLLAKEHNNNIGFFKYAVDMATQWYVRHDINPKLMNNVMSSIRITAPNYNEQNSIAFFLDRETERIDNLIVKKQRQMELLQEKRSALISHAVTRGLDPNVKMKDSGVDWLGEIPAHWETRKLKYIVSINDQSLPEDTSLNYEIEYIDISGVEANKGIVKQESYIFGDAPSRARRIVRDGDIIISTVRTYLKAICYIDKPLPNLIVSTGFAVVRPIKVNPNYLTYILNSAYFVETVVSRSVGVSYPAINALELGNIVIAFPDGKEQSRIASYLKEQNRFINDIIAKLNISISKLQEYRTALISAAVTGKIDVRQEVA